MNLNSFGVCYEEKGLQSSGLSDLRFNKCFIESLKGNFDSIKIVISKKSHDRILNNETDQPKNLVQAGQEHR